MTGSSMDPRPTPDDLLAIAGRRLRASEAAERFLRRAHVVCLLACAAAWCASVLSFVRSMPSRGVGIGLVAVALLSAAKHARELAESARANACDAVMLAGSAKILKFNQEQEQNTR